MQRLGLDFHSGHRAEEAEQAELIVYSSAIKAENPVLAAARRLGKPCARRAEALAAIMRGKRGIVMAGMHGKTTTSAMTAHVLREGGLHPSHYVGAEIPILGTNAHWDPRGEYFVAEGDESDGTLEFFHPEHALILNIEEEHLDFYKDLAAIERGFRQIHLDKLAARFFIARTTSTPRDSCASCARRHFLWLSTRRRIIAGANIELQNFTSVFCVYRRGETAGRSRPECSRAATTCTMRWV